jgi:tetratricopeptide (TPR) repeat protein
MFAVLDDPAQAAVAFDYGNECLERGEAAAAVAAFRHCVDRTPHHVASWFNLANAQMRHGRASEAAESLVRCLRLAPDFGPGHVNLATALLRLGFLDDAAAIAAIAVRLLPDQAEAHACRGGILHHAGQHEAAIGAYRRALSLDPGRAAILSSLGNTLGATGRADEGLAAHDRAIALAPNDPVCRFNRSMTLLAAGHFAEGWAEYEWRWRRHGRGLEIAAPQWRGEPLEGRTILLHAEQGFGDTLQFCRYAPMVAQCGGHVLLEVQAPLARLLANLPGVGQIIARGERRPAFDLHCPLLSLPNAFRTTLETVPARLPYLYADRAQTARWQASLSGNGGLRVGLVWAGAPHLDDPEAMLLDQRRSLPPNALAVLAHLPGAHFVSLQKDTPPPAIDGLVMTDVMAEMRDFADTAGLIGALDLIVAVDTSVAHLAAALGREVWLLSRYDGCWRWLRNRTDSPWYPGMTLFRQPRPHDWTTVLRDVRAQLEDRIVACPIAHRRR